MPLNNKQRQAKWRAKQKRKMQRMETKAYSIRDSKAEVFNPPFYKKTHGEAERDFTTLTRDEKSTVAQYPEDYDLYYLGTFDDSSGKFEPLNTPQHIIKAVQVLNKKPI